MISMSHQVPELTGYVFWSVFSRDDKAKQAVLDDDAGRAYAMAMTAQQFEIPLQDVRAELFEHPSYNRRVWHAYVKDIHRAKVIYVLEEMDLRLRVLKELGERGL